MCFARLVAGALVAAFLGLSPAHAGPRVALIIGNSIYRNAPVLPNPQNDANDIAASLGRLEFSVKKVLNGTFDDIRRALLQFGREARGADMAVVYFAGHGMEIGGDNWLIPVDAELRTDTDAENEAINLRAVMLQVANATTLGLVILDACRNNPFAAKMQRTSRLRAVTRGLNRVEPSDNVLVAYSAKDGTTADDGSGRNSPFTAALLRNMETPGLEIQFMFRTVRDEVMSATRREQQPFVYGSLSKEAIYLKAALAAPLPPSSTSPAKPAVGIFETPRLARPLTKQEERALKPKDSFKECDQCPEMVAIPAGTFLMGSPGEKDGWDAKGGEKPQHRVTIARSFAAGRFLVTVDQFAAFIKETRYDAGSKCFLAPREEVDKGKEWKEKAGNSWRNPGYAQTGSHPAACVNWHDAKAYAAWLSRKTGREYRLLTEAEWEYAARAGTTTPYYFGGDSKMICAFGNGYDQTAAEGWGKNMFKSDTTTESQAPSCRDGFAYTAAVGSFAPNAFTLYDMVGNVWETVEDCANGSYEGAPVDGSAWLSGDCSHRMRRGGSFYMDASILASTTRFAGTRDDRVDDVGFRVARVLDQ
jgi:formylglycine-generating enzyme required for sulfatase activity